jgi:predicted kinase
MSDLIQNQEHEALESRIENLPREEQRAMLRRVLARKGADFTASVLDCIERNREGPAATREDFIEAGFTAEEIDAAERGEIA